MTFRLIAFSIESFTPGLTVFFLSGLVVSFFHFFWIHRQKNPIYIVLIDFYLKKCRLKWYVDSRVTKISLKRIKKLVKFWAVEGP